MLRHRPASATVLDGWQRLAIFLVGVAFLCVGFAQRVYNRNPIVQSRGTIVSANRSVGSHGIEKDEGDFRVLLSSGQIVTLSTGHWDSHLQTGQSGLFTFDGHVLLLRQANFDSLNRCPEPILHNEEDLRRLMNPWMWLAGLVVLLAFNLRREPQRCGQQPIHVSGT